MKALITIGFSLLLFSCHRNTAPQVTTVTKDSIVYKVVPHDTTIYIPGATVEVLKPVPCPDFNFDTTAVSDNVKLHVNITKGHLTATCKADSLQKVISLLHATMEHYKAIVNTVTVPVNVPKPYIPKWVLLLIVANVGLIAWKFRNPIITLIKSFV
jgi:hypothetical protein